jgi:hypothetical protein
LIDATADWLMTQALGDTGMEQLVEGCCQRLWAAGVPLGRAMIGYRTLHPLFTGVAHIWRRDAPLVTERHDQRPPHTLKLRFLDSPSQTSQNRLYCRMHCPNSPQEGHAAHVISRPNHPIPNRHYRHSIYPNPA